MFCPLCKAEYREGVATCATCGATLVAANATEDQRNPPSLIWKTSNRADFDRAVDSLREAGVAFRAVSRNDDWLHRLLRQRPAFEIRLLESDKARAAFLEEVQSARVQPADRWFRWSNGLSKVVRCAVSGFLPKTSCARCAAPI